MFLSAREVTDLPKTQVLVDSEQSSIPDITGVSTDTRTIKPGSCFIALEGANFDGHDFLSSAVERGANLLIVSRIPPKSSVATMLVPDTLFFLGELARTWRNKNRQVKVTAVVGSSGKTTTKEMTAAVLGEATLVTRGNLNNLIGLPHMVFELTPEHERAVLEMGMNMPGELKRLMEIASPDFLVMTNITNAHIGMFGSQDALYMAKTDSFRGARPDTTLILNIDDPLSMRAKKEYAAGRPVILYGLHEDAEIRAENIINEHPFGYSFDLVAHGDRQRVHLASFGRHNISNALAAAATGTLYEIPLAEIAGCLSEFEPKANRSEVENVAGWYVIKDYYNASPAAVEAALKSLGDFNVTGRRFAVLADMLELGDMEQEFHEYIGEVAAESGVDRLITLGDRGRWISSAARRKGLLSEHVANAETAAELLRPELRAGDLVLIKGSRLMKLETLYSLLKG